MPPRKKQGGNERDEMVMTREKGWKRWRKKRGK